MIEFDDQMKKMLDEVDKFIEDKYGSDYPLHPARPKRGETANPQADGLFGIRADFTPGYGSEFGRGYLINIEIKTLEFVPYEIRYNIYRDTAKKIKELLPVYFPGRKLILKKDGNHCKLLGDFSLGTL